MAVTSGGTNFRRHSEFEAMARVRDGHWEHFMKQWKSGEKNVDMEGKAIACKADDADHIMRFVMLLLLMMMMMMVVMMPPPQLMQKLELFFPKSLIHTLP